MGLIEQLQELIRQRHGCDATHIGTAPISEKQGGGIAWQGNMHLFQLHGHQRARRCFAWQHTGTEDAPRYVALLEHGHVDSARAAVRAAMVDESRRQGD